MKILLGVAGVAALAVSTYATPIFTVGNNPQPNETNVLFNTNQSASMVTGLTNQGNFTVDFSSTTDTLITTAKGQSNLTAADGLINNVTISLAGGLGFGDIILNPSAAPKTSSTALVTVTLVGGATQSFTLPPTGTLGNGSNFLTITAGSGPLISSVNISSTAGFDTLRQVRISGIPGGPTPPPSTVPEPASMALMGAGLLLLPLFKRRKRA